MSNEIQEPDWLAAERNYEDPMRERGTIPELFEKSAAANLDGEAQLFKGGIYDRSIDHLLPDAQAGEYESISYRQMRRIVRNLATGFRELGLEADDRVGLFCNTRMEWAQTDYAVLAAGCVVTTVYTDSSPTQAEYLLSDPEASAVVVENEQLLERVLEVEDSLDLEFMVVVDEPESEYERDDIYTLGDVHDIGEEQFDEATYEGWIDDRQPDDLASLVYTSGTTGQPKGVRLTHWNFRSNVHMIRRRAGPRPDEPDRPCISSDSTTISFLPLAHVFERTVGSFVSYGSGATVGYAESTDTISEDINKIQPTTAASVPRVYERIFDSMREQAAESSVKERIFNWGLDVAIDYQQAEDPGSLLRLKHSVADKLVYSTVREQLGGNIEIMVSGGGSLSTDLCRMFNGMGIVVTEGYGLTETAPVVSTNSVDDIRPGTLGTPLIGVDVAIDESAVDQDDVDREVEGSTVGELLVRGENVTDGYWNKPGATERAFTDDPTESTRTAEAVAADGAGADTGKWFRTGDLVEQTPDGFLLFQERLKQIIVPDTGKNVAPQPIEDLFSTNDRVEQIMVVGDNQKFVGAIIVPNFESMRKWADEEGIDLPENNHAAIEDDRAREWVSEAVDEANEQLEKHEKIRDFALVGEEWTPENNMLTPSMKKVRNTILDVHEEKMAEIYGEDYRPKN
ncbi:AMP-dependent synthetase/ligase [Halovenus sp. HT40]|uniref:AMP-dependent synthetase/ligase n=1 Tax=Halovenus sp. HT40 TaxID=3126691 RepID=UPI003FA56E8B